MPQSNLFRIIDADSMRIRISSEAVSIDKSNVPNGFKASSAEFQYALSFGIFYIFNSRDRKM
jgi:hypothetical protein